MKNEFGGLLYQAVSYVVGVIIASGTAFLIIRTAINTFKEKSQERKDTDTSIDNMGAFIENQNLKNELFKTKQDSINEKINELTTWIEHYEEQNKLLDKNIAIMEYKIERLEADFKTIDSKNSENLSNFIQTTKELIKMIK